MSTSSTYKVISPPNDTNQFPMVSSLIDPITKWWRVNTVRATFLPFKADTILRIPLSHNLLEDKIIWIRSSCEVFIVKSGYHLAHNLLESNAREECSNGNLCKHVWRKLWHLTLPAKVKIFAWRVCVNGLPTMEAINYRGISQSKTCPVCRNEVESLDHALLHCPFSASIWCLWPKKPLSTLGIKKPFLDSTIFIISHATSQDLKLLFPMAWAIWYNKNRIVHKGCRLLLNQMWQLAKNSVDNFVYSATWDLSQPRALPTSWVPPSPIIHKINVDGASSELESFLSVGIVIKDCLGQVVAALCKPLQARFPAELTEIITMEQGVILAQDL